MIINQERLKYLKCIRDLKSPKIADVILELGYNRDRVSRMISYMEEDGLITKGDYINGGSRPIFLTKKALECLKLF